MRKFRIGVAIFAGILFIGQMAFLNFDNLNWSNNSSNYITMISMVCVVFAMLQSNRFEKNKQKEL